MEPREYIHNHHSVPPESKDRFPVAKILAVLVPAAATCFGVMVTTGAQRAQADVQIELDRERTKLETRSIELNHTLEAERLYAEELTQSRAHQQHIDRLVVDSILAKDIEPSQKLAALQYVSHTTEISAVRDWAARQALKMKELQDDTSSLNEYRKSLLIQTADSKAWIMVDSPRMRELKINLGEWTNKNPCEKKKQCDETGIKLATDRRLIHFGGALRIGAPGGGAAPCRDRGFINNRTDYLPRELPEGTTLRVYDYESCSGFAYALVSITALPKFSPK